MLIMIDMLKTSWDPVILAIGFQNFNVWLSEGFSLEVLESESPNSRRRSIRHLQVSSRKHTPCQLIVPSTSAVMIAEGALEGIKGTESSNTNSLRKLNVRRVTYHPCIH